MIYNQVINNNMQGWKDIKNARQKANKMTDFTHNISIANNNRIDEIADNVMNVQMNSIYNLNHIENYRQRLKIYNIMSKYPAINRAISMHVNELLMINEDGEFIDFSFTELGKTNIPENIKYDMNNIIHSLFKTGYSLTKLKRDLGIFFVEGTLCYNMVVDENDCIRLRRMNNGSYYVFVWNDEPKYIIEFTNIEQLTDEDLNKLREDIDRDIAQEMTMKLTSASYGAYRTQEYNEVCKFHPIDSCLYLRWYENASEETNNTISFLENVAPLYNRLATMEAHLVAYRINRSIATYAINLDFGKMEFNQKTAMMQRYMDEYDTETIYNPLDDTTTNIKDVQTVKSTYWFAKGDDQGPSTVEPIDHTANFSEIDDIRYFASQFQLLMRCPLNRIGAITGIEKMEGMKTSSLEGAGELREEIEYQKFLDNIRTTVCDEMIGKWFQTVCILKNLKEHVVNINNFNIKLYEDSKNKLFMKSLELSKRMEMVDMLGNYLSTDSLLKDYLGFNDAEFSREIKSKLEEREIGLDVLFGEDKEALTLEQIDAIRAKYIIGDKEYKVTTERHNNLYDNINEKYNRRENRLKLLSFVNYFKNIIKINAMDTNDLYKSANDKVVAKNRTKK